MGIVVCVAMALGLIAFMPMPWAGPERNESVKGSVFGKIKAIAPIAVLVFGAWNSLWYGLQNAASFWGKAGLISGLIMMLSSVVLTPEDNRNKIISWFYQLLNPIRIPLFVALLASFLLYLVTLIQLNLGMPIIS